jgi:hypothetical protein
MSSEIASKPSLSIIKDREIFIGYGILGKKINS